MLQYDDFDELSDLVDQNGGVHTTHMGALRDAKGYGKLGVHVVRAISQDLAGYGLGHFPTELEPYQEQQVRVYRLGSPIAELIDAVINPSATHDEELRAAAGGDDARILRQIRNLICA